MKKIVIGCAGSKQGGYFETFDRRKVKFVARPKCVPEIERNDFLFARPDDPSLDCPGKTWRDLVQAYNATEKDRNPFGLSHAYRLYTPPIYTKLVDRFKKENVFILSAGWGLIASNFLTPNYDITFSKDKNVPFHARRDEKKGRLSRFLPDAGRYPGRDISFRWQKLSRPFLEVDAESSGSTHDICLQT